MKTYFQIILLILCHGCLLAQTDYAPALELSWDELTSELVAATNNFECKKPHNQDTTDSFDISAFEPILSAECEPLTTVGHCVNVVSGHFFQVDKDLIGNGIEPLDLVRYYDSGNESESFLGFGFGSQFPLWASDIQEGARHCYVAISEREGFLIPYKGRSDFRGKVCGIDPRLMEKGYTNLSRAAISGHANFVNWKAIYRSTEESSEKYWQVLKNWNPLIIL